MNINDKVQYLTPLADEIGLTFTIVEIDTNVNWCKIQANIDMNIKPTYTANLSDLQLVNSL